MQYTVCNAMCFFLFFMSRSDGGYECEFVDVPRDDDYCIICLLPARDPQQTKCECAKLYCKSCYGKLKSTSGTCPTCRQPLDAFPDRNSARRVKSMRVKCPTKGCPWVNELGSLDKHLETCGFVLMPCANGCKELIFRDKLLLHRTEMCPLRRCACKYCKSSGTYREMTGTHLEKCPGVMVPCPNTGCGEWAKRNEMASHQLLCQYVTIDCPYKDVGCNYTSARHTMEDHKATSCGHHLDLAMVQLKKQVIHYDRKECTAFITKMPQFSLLKDCSTTWQSPGFYTHPCGYRMCILVYPNGIGKVKGTHVSVCLCLMKGDFDDTLTWPIRYKCTITLLNQLEDEYHHDMYPFTYSEDKETKVNCRIIDNKKIGQGQGYSDFIPHGQLSLQEDKQCQYLKDDSLYFRVQVEVLPACKPWLMVTVPSEDPQDDYMTYSYEAN